MDRLSVAASGLSVAAAQLSASAHNVANARTTGFEPVAVAAQEAPLGGVKAVLGSATEGREPRAAERGADVDRALLAPSKTDLVAETANRAAASALYRASLASLASAEETDEALYHLVR